MLEVKNITKTFGGVKALEDVSFSLTKGEILGLIGPNGSGKTTLFNTISGVYKPEGGEILFQGRRITGLTPFAIAKMGIGRTFQVVKPFEHITLLQNVMVPALYGRKQVSLGEAEQEAAKWLDFVGLASKKDELIKELTLSQRRGLEVARALALNPELILLDEVMAGLNPVEVAEAIKIVRRIRQDLKITVLMVEHIMKAVMGLSDRLVVLNHGKKIAEGNPLEISRDTAVIQAYLGKTFASG